MMTKLRATAFQIFPKKNAPHEVTSVRRGALRQHFVKDRRFKPILSQSARIIRTQIYDKFLPQIPRTIRGARTEES